MFVIRYDIVINNDLLTARMERRVRRIMKKALQWAVAKWHHDFAKRHFTRAAYTLYPAEYRKRKKKGRPLYVSGTLENQILNQHGRIRGTSNHVTLFLALGRPAQYQGEMLRLKVIKRMAYQLSRGIRESYREAEGNVLKRAGYRLKQKKYFQILITAVRGSEQQHLTNFVKRYMIQEFKKAKIDSKKVRKAIRA